MKILLVGSDKLDFEYGGGQVYVKNLVAGLLAQQHDASYMSIAFKDISLPQRLLISCNNIKELQLIMPANWRVERNPTGKSYITEEIASVYKELSPDIVHAHGWEEYSCIAARQSGITCLITAHHGGIVCPAGTLLNHRDEICRIKANPKDCLPCVLKNIRGGLVTWPLLKIIPLSFRLQLGRLMQKLPFIFYFTPVLQASLSIQKEEEEWETMYTNASLVIAPSQAIADCMKLNGAPANKIKVVPHGIPLPETSLLTEDKKINKENQPLKFFFVGRICHVKGVHVMLAAFSQLSTNAELHIIGGAGNKTEERYMQRLKIISRHNPRIIWHGKVKPPEVNRLITQFDIMVHPTICLEVFGLNIAEALALGKPVIATRCGGPEMQVEDGVNGWLVKPNNANDLVEKISYVIIHLGEIYRLSDKICQPVSIEEHTKKLLSVYSNNQLLDN